MPEKVGPFLKALREECKEFIFFKEKGERIEYIQDCLKKVKKHKVVDIDCVIAFTLEYLTKYNERRQQKGKDAIIITRQTIHDYLDNPFHHGTIDWHLNSLIRRHCIREDKNNVLTLKH